MGDGCPRLVFTGGQMSELHKFRWMGMAADGESVTLRKYKGEFQAPAFATAEWFAANPDLWRQGAALDVETTGRSSVTDKVIEIGIRCFRFHRETGEVLSREEGYSALQDPGEPLTPEIVRITGITDADLKGQKIDWPHVQALLEQAQIVVAHNASFDRPFMDRLLPVSTTKIWGCSFKQVDWTQKGFPSQKLEILAIYHGFFCNAHRALADADTLLNLLQMPDPGTGTPYFKELLFNARRKMVIVAAVKSPIETKDALKNRGYRWDPDKRVWSKLIYLEEKEEEVTWLTDAVYSGYYQGMVKELALSDSFKAGA
jgi:DNA polymerase-3 subunit epsilon